MDKEWEKRIFWSDTKTLEFEAVVIRIKSGQNHCWGLVLNQTAFYPESGGQPCDLGTISGRNVLRVVEEDNDIVHYVEDDDWRENTTVHGCVDKQRRHVHMQQHSGQHILSQCFARLMKAETVSFHMGSGYSTIDIQVSDISDEQAQLVEKEANRIVEENRPVYTSYVSADDLERFDLRKPPVKHGYIRVVSIDDFDHVPCGGTHVANTGAVGIIKIVKHENYKGMTRIYFCCGSRAHEDYSRKHSVLCDISQLLTAGWENIPGIIRKLKEENHQLVKKQNEILDSILPVEADNLVREADQVNGITVVQKVIPNRSKEQMVKLVKHLVKSPLIVAMLVSTSQEKLHAVFACGSNVKLDMREYLGVFLKDLNGKGGGRPEMAQGGGTMKENLPELLASLKNILSSDLSK